MLCLHGSKSRFVATVVTSRVKTRLDLALPGFQPNFDLVIPFMAVKCLIPLEICVFVEYPCKTFL